jgi:hypothetical protein
MAARSIWCRVLVFLCISATGRAADWPRFRGPGGQGHAVGDVAPMKWGPGENIAWKTPLPGPGSSSPIVSGDRVFLTCYSGYGLAADQGNPADLKRHALCLDRATGKILWNISVPAPLPETVYTGRYIVMHGYASATPVTDGRTVFFFLAKSGVFAFDFNGNRLWHADVGAGAHDWGSGASPILLGDLLIVNAAAESDQLIALDKRTGKQVWAARGVARAWNTPAAADLGAGRMELLLANQSHIRSFDPRDGSELWRCAGIRAAELCPSIVTRGDTGYLVGSPKGETMAFRLGGKGDVSADAVRWRINKGSNVVSPVLHEGLLYFASDTRGTLHAVDAATGESVYEQRLDPRPGQVYASPVRVKDKLYYFSRTAGAYIVQTGSAFKLLAHNPPLDPASCSASPAIVDGQIFIRSDAAAYRIQQK